MTTGRFDLTGRVALVSGASRGIGFGLAVGLAEAGADLALAARTREGLEACAAKVRQMGRRAEVIPVDVGTPAGAQAMVTGCLEHYGRVDVLVNVAGTTRRKPALEMTEEDWDAVQNTNLKAVFFACQAAARAMIAQGGGKIINIGSLTATIGIRNVSAYGASKGGVVQLTRALAVEWAQQGIQVNVIGPGYLDTELTRPLLQNPEGRAWVLSRIPMGKLGIPDDLVGTTIFLASPASDYVTGQIINVDGGWLAS